MWIRRHFFKGPWWLWLIGWALHVAIAPQVALGAALTEFERLENLPAEHPLAEQWVRVIIQDRDGFLWLGTINGLHRFDGYAVMSFRHDPGNPRSLSNNFINSIFEDSQGVLWIATMGGLSRMDDQQAGDSPQGRFVTADRADLFTVFRHDPDDPNSLSEDRVYSVAEDRQGALWVATGSGVSRFDRESQSFDRFPLNPSEPSEPSERSEPTDLQTMTLVRSRSGDLWLGSEGPALWRFEASSQTFEQHPLPRRASETELLYRIAEDASGFLWCGTEGGSLYRFDPRVQEFQSFDLGDERRGYITALLPQPNGELWIGTDHQGLLILDPATADVEFHRPSDQPGTLSDHQLSTIFRDRSGILWFGTSAGLDKLDPSQAQFTLYRHRLDDPASLSSDTVNALAEDADDGLWIGTEKGLERMDRNGRITHRYRHHATDAGLLSDSVGAVFQDRAGDLWVGTDQGLDHLDAERQAFVHYRPDPSDPDGLISTVYCLVEIDPGILWIGGHRGLNRLESSTRRLQYFEEPGSVIAMLADAEDQLWLATYGGGLQRFDPGSEVFTAYRHDSDNPQSLSSNFLVALHQTESGHLWIGTLGGGLSHFDPDQQAFTNYREPDGLRNTNVVGILEDAAGHLWLSTDGGLNRFDPATETWTRFTVEDGLQGLDFSPGAAWLSSTGEMFFGGTTGLTAFRPEEITGDPLAPPVAITDFLLLNRSTPFAARRSNDRSTAAPHLILDHRDDILAFRFAALQYSKPQQHRYAYQLVGFNDEWVETDPQNRLAQYTNLDPGDYLFRVKAANPDGVWNEEGASARLTVLPPPWQTWWAYTAYALMLLAGISAYVRSHQLELRRQRQTADRERQAADRERAVSQRLREVDRLKDEFLANTSHELRTPLYGITGLAQSLIDGTSGELPAEAQTNLSMIAASGRRLSHLVGDLLDFSKLRHQSLELQRGPVDLKPLVEVVLTLSQPLVGAKALELRNAVPTDLPAADADENRLQQILHNLISNAVKFTEAGSVTVSAAVADDLLQVQVSDSGIGIPKADQKRIFDAFEQADASIERQFGGTGLGLAVTRQLVEIHDGRIWVESAPGEGASFCFTLPIAKEPSRLQPSEATSPVSPVSEVPEPIRPSVPIPVPIAVETADPPTDSAGPQNGEAARLLVVDDEPVNLQVVRNYLVGEEFDLTLASSGEAALRLLEERTFDLVLLDVMMPRVSGYEVCRSLRESHAIADLPVIFLTARAQDADLVTGMGLGANDFLTKPISKDRLLARIRPHLDLLQIHRNLEDLVQEKMSEIKMLEGILPICAGCKKIREDDGSWSPIELYIDARSEAQFSHGMCPNCVNRFYEKHPELRS